MKIFSQPYNLFGIVGLMTILFSAFYNTNRTLDLYIHDTVFIVSASQVLKTLAAILLFIWLIYLFILKNVFSQTITWIHTIGTMLVAVYILVITYNIQDTGRAYSNGWTSFERMDRFSFIGLIFLICQFLFVFNIIASLIKFRGK